MSQWAIVSLLSVFWRQLLLEAKMAVKTWETIRVRYCDHAQAEVGFQAQVVYPAEFLPEQAPRVIAHRCSHAFACNLDNRPSCIWAGTNPAFDPFKEKP